ncbi:MarR family winged helix-turn-helix transcriptional regulator [Tsuneonella mangrovi]|uniref:MarR family winged helix-turn-helix transcriptional regulator n=1 Tax=Tsuneonella mangrovi TaxID=1982042 RepID=UPI000BA22BF3|nr:MarR family transcriptional regulator [Tsuneonella mangrovi]
MEKNIGYVLSDSARLMRRSFNEQVRSLGITSTQARLLLMLNRHPGENQTAYAERLEVEPITLCRMVDRMEEAGMVQRHPDPRDRRARILQLTNKSRKEIERIQQATKVLMDNMLAGLDEEEEAQLMALLGRVSDNLANGSKELAAHG